jgi:hypothetical protein
VHQQINDQLESTTKRTIMENERLASELAYQSMAVSGRLFGCDARYGYRLLGPGCTASHLIRH